MDAKLGRMHSAARRVGFIAACVVATFACEARADEPKRDYRVGLFENLGTNIVDSVSGPNLLLHATAIGSTAALSVGGADDEIQRWFWRDNVILGGTVTDVAFLAGWVTPAVIPGVIALTGLALDDSKHASGGVTALQAVGINALIVQVVKLGTGRPLPYKDGVPDDGERIQRTDDGGKWFSFGGVAWPSGHTSAHMALASSLVAFYREVKWLPFVAYPLVAVVGVSMVEGDHHWFSDVVAGALVGHAIGWTTGSNMRRKYDDAHGKTTDDSSAMQIMPVLSRGTFMLTLSL